MSGAERGRAPAEERRRPRPIASRPPRAFRQWARRRGGAWEVPRVSTPTIRHPRGAPRARLCGARGGAQPPVLPWGLRGRRAGRRRDGPERGLRAEGTEGSARLVTRVSAGPPPDPSPRGEDGTFPAASGGLQHPVRPAGGRYPQSRTAPSPQGSHTDPMGAAARFAGSSRKNECGHPRDHPPAGCGDPMGAATPPTPTRWVQESHGGCIPGILPEGRRDLQDCPRWMQRSRGPRLRPATTHCTDVRAASSLCSAELKNNGIFPSSPIPQVEGMSPPC